MVALAYACLHEVLFSVYQTSFQLSLLWFVYPTFFVYSVSTCFPRLRLVIGEILHWLVRLDPIRMSQSNTGAVAFVLILAVPIFWYLTLFKNVFETCLNIKISLDTVSLKQIHKENHPLTSLGSTIASINQEPVNPTCKNEKSTIQKIMVISRSSSIKCKIRKELLITRVFLKIGNLKYFENLFFFRFSTF